MIRCSSAARLQLFRSFSAVLRCSFACSLGLLIRPLIWPAHSLHLHCTSLHRTVLALRVTAFSLYLHCGYNDVIHTSTYKLSTATRWGRGYAVPRRPVAFLAFVRDTPDPRPCANTGPGVQVAGALR